MLTIKPRNEECRSYFESLYLEILSHALNEKWSIEIETMNKLINTFDIEASLWGSVCHPGHERSWCSSTLKVTATSQHVFSSGLLAGWSLREHAIDFKPSGRARAAALDRLYWTIAVWKRKENREHGLPMLRLDIPRESSSWLKFLGILLDFSHVIPSRMSLPVSSQRHRSNSFCCSAQKEVCSHFFYIYNGNWLSSWVSGTS